MNLSINRLCKHLNLECLAGDEDAIIKGVNFSLPINSGPIAVLVRENSQSIGFSEQWCKNNSSIISMTLGVSATGPVKGIPHLKTDDFRKMLYSLAIRARNEIGSGGRFISVVGSAGKTTTTSMLGHVLKSVKVHDELYIFGNGNTPLYIASELISAPTDAHFYLLEIAGATEDGVRPIAEASAELVRPDITIFTSLSHAHMDKMGTLQNAAFKKASAFHYLNDNGTAVINRDIPYYDTVSNRVPRGAALISYGLHNMSDIRLINYNPQSGSVIASVSGEHHEFTCGGQGIHNALNCLGVMAALIASGIGWKKAMDSLRLWRPLRGRGRTFNAYIDKQRFTVIDESYNANPASMSAAINNLQKCKSEGRRIAVLGEMLELGEETSVLHDCIITDIINSDIDRTYVCGESFRLCYHRIPSKNAGGLYESATELWDKLKEEIHEGDVVMFKGSNGTRLHEIVKMLETM